MPAHSHFSSALGLTVVCSQFSHIETENIISTYRIYCDDKIVHSTKYIVRSKLSVVIITVHSSKLGCLCSYL